MKIVTLLHQKGGVGKSTLAFNLAVNLRSSAKVCIIDVDYQGSLHDIKDVADLDIFHISDLDKVKELNYDIIFIDTPPYLFEGIESVCQLSDVIVIPTKAGVADMLSIKKTINLLKSYHCEDKSFVVLNMVKPKTTLTEEIRAEIETYGLKVSPNLVSDFVDFSRSLLLNGVEQNVKAQKQVDQLTKEILTKAL